jgi:hypothetical protein
MMKKIVIAQIIYYEIKLYKYYIENFDDTNSIAAITISSLATLANFSTNSIATIKDVSLNYFN